MNSTCCFSGCPANDTSIFYISDTVDPCSFYWCVRGTFVRHRSLKCAPGSGTVADYAGYHNPCTEMIAECRRKTSDGRSQFDHSNINTISNEFINPPNPMFDSKMMPMSDIVFNFFMYLRGLVKLKNIREKLGIW